MPFLSDLQPLDGSIFSTHNGTTYVAEVSDHQLPVGWSPGLLHIDGFTRGVSVRWPDGSVVRYALTKTDRDASGEDIYGWHLHSTNPFAPQRDLLLIND